MATRIQSITVDDIVDKRVALNNSQMGRVISIGNDWSLLRVGIRYALDDAAVSITGGPKLCFGVMSEPASGMANGPLSGAGTGHYIGTWHTGSGAPTWTRQAGPPVRYDGQVYMVKKVSATVTQLAALNNAKHSATPTIRKIAVLEVTKSGAATTLYMTFPTTWTNTDYSKQMLIHAMEIPSQPNVNAAVGESVYGAANNGDPVTINEGADGDLNSIVIAWDRAVIPAFISDVMWSKHA